MTSEDSRSLQDTYSEDVLKNIYELGRMYYEMGYFAPAERIFGGLAQVDQGITPARVALGVIKLERNLFAEAINHFRFALQANISPISAKLGLAASFIAQADAARARSLLTELGRVIDEDPHTGSDIRQLYEALLIRVS